MGLQEALQNIWSSDYVQKNPNKAYKTSYGSEYAAVAAYLNGGVEPNWSGFSKMGKGLCEVEKERRLAVPVDPPPVDPPPVDPPPVDLPPNGTQVSPGTGNLKTACDAAKAGDTLVLAAGVYTENATCVLKPGVSLVGAGGVNGASVIRGSGAPLIQVTGGTVGQKVGGVKLDGQKSTLRGLTVQSSTGVEVYDVWSVGFVGGTFGGCAHFEGITNCTIRDSVFTNGGHNNPTYVSGAVMVGVATGCTFKNLTVHDDLYMALKCAQYGTTAWTNCQFLNSSFTVGALMLPNGASGSIAFECHNVHCSNVEIGNCYFDANLSIPNDDPIRQWNWIIHNCHFKIQGFSQYAIEFDTNSMHCHHNYFQNGGSPLSAYSGAKSGSSVHHNVFDNIDYRCNGMVDSFSAGVQNFEFYNNTMLWRPPQNNVKPVFLHNSSSSANIHHNIFSSVPSGASLGTMGTVTLASNVFFHVAASGSGAVTASAQPLSTVGGFPAAYVPTSAYTSYGAFADGQFTVGIQ